MLYLAVLRAGYVFLPLNTAYQAAEIEYFVGNAEPAVVVCTRAQLRLGQQDRLQGRHAPRLHARRRPQRQPAGARRASQRPARTRRRACGADDLAAILYTSGTTGRSKGAMLSTATCCRNARMLKDYWGWRSGDVLIHALPIFHVHGLFVASHGALLNGSKMIWFSKFDAAR